MSALTFIKICWVAKVRENSFTKLVKICDFLCSRLLIITKTGIVISNRGEQGLHFQSHLAENMLVQCVSGN